MQHIGRSVHDGRRCLPGAGELSRQSEKDLQGYARRSRDRRRHRSPHSRADPHNAGQHPRGRETPDPEYHPPDGLGRGHLRGEFGQKSPRRAAYPAPPLPRHGERQAGRRMRRHRQVLRRRSRMDPAGHVPADPAELPALDSVHGLDGIDDGQPVRHLRHLLRYHVVRRTGGTHGTPETRNERRKNHRTVDPRDHRSHRRLRSRRQGQADRGGGRLGLRQGGADPAQAFRRAAGLSWEPAP